MENELTPMSEGVSIGNAQIAKAEFFILPSPERPALNLVIRAPNHEDKIACLRIVYRDALVRCFTQKGYDEERLNEVLAPYDKWFDEQFPKISQLPELYAIYQQTELRVSCTRRARPDNDLEVQIMENIGTHFSVFDDRYDDSIKKISAMIPRQ